MAQPDTEQLEKRARESLAQALVHMLEATGFPVHEMAVQDTNKGTFADLLLAQRTEAPSATPPAAAPATTDRTSSDAAGRSGTQTPLQRTAGNQAAVAPLHEHQGVQVI